MVVGKANVGKTTLVKQITQLFGTMEKVAIFVNLWTRKPTDGIDIFSWRADEKTTFWMWDFAGQELYYFTHQFFISDDALYILVFNVTESFEENKIMYWLNSVGKRNNLLVF